MGRRSTVGTRFPLPLARLHRDALNLPWRTAVRASFLSPRTVCRRQSARPGLTGEVEQSSRARAHDLTGSRHAVYIVSDYPSAQHYITITDNFGE